MGRKGEVRWRWRERKRRDGEKVAENTGVGERRKVREYGKNQKASKTYFFNNSVHFKWNILNII